MTTFTDEPWESPEPELDANAFCNVCLIDLNPEGKEKTKSNCKLPIRKTPNGPIYKAALRNAAARLEQTDAPASAIAEARAKLKNLMDEAGIKSSLARINFAQTTITHQAIIIQPGTANGLTFSKETLSTAAKKFEGAPVFIDHATPQDLQRPGGRSVRDLAGRINTTNIDPNTGAVTATLQLFSNAAWLQDLITEASDTPFFGLSADVWLSAEDGNVREINAVESVDIVINPAAGGKFLPTQQVTQSKEKPKMDEKLEHTTLTKNPEPQPQAPPEQAHTEASAVIDVVANLTIETSKLPDNVKDTLRAEFAQHRSLEKLQEKIDAYKQAYAEAAAQYTVRGLGQTHIRALDSLDRIALAFERLMGLPVQDAHSEIPRLSGIREMYDLLTGDYERRGLFHPDRIQFANATTSTMSNVVANVLNKVMLRAFEMRPQWWKPIATEEDFQTTQTIRWITLGGFSDLETVAEGDAYNEKQWDDSYETSSFVKKGNYIGLTLEMIDRDDVGAVRAIPRKLGLAAARTLSSTVAALFTANSGIGPALSDGKALFHSDHGNLGTTALDANAWDATIQAMFKQSEFNSSKRLGIRPRFCLVPIELEKTALTIFTSDREPGTSDNDANVRRMSDSVITVPEWTDTNNWAAAADPLDLPGICIGYRFGRNPEMFVADNELTGSMFTNDEMRIKIRFIYAVGIGDYRALYKHNVA